MTVVAGIDVGFTGGVAFIHVASGKAVAYPMPLGLNSRDEKIVDFDGLARLLASNMPNVVCIESVWGIAGQGAKAMFRFGEAFGTVVSAVRAGRYRHAFVNPKTWQGLIIPYANGETKRASAEFCRQKYPDVDLLLSPKAKKPHDGISDAVCIAHYGMLHMNGCPTC